jgi:hypothetical protein
VTATTGPFDLIAAMRLEDGRRWGQVATDWQLADARAVLTPGPDDARLHWLTRPKGASKSTDLAAVALAWLLGQAAPLDEGHVIASDHEQPRRLLTRAAGLIARTPGLDQRLLGRRGFGLGVLGRRGSGSGSSREGVGAVGRRRLVVVATADDGEAPADDEHEHYEDAQAHGRRLVLRVALIRRQRRSPFPLGGYLLRASGLLGGLGFVGCLELRQLLVGVLLRLRLSLRRAVTLALSRAGAVGATGTVSVVSVEPDPSALPA